jgi:hypothetical protein
MRVYRYGCRVREVPPEVEEQFALAHRMWNDAVAVHRAHDAARLEASNTAVADLVARRDALDAEIGKLRASVAAARQKARRDVDAGVTRDRMQALRAERKEVAAALQAARADARERVQPLLEAETAAEHAEIAALRQRYASLGLYWGTYNTVLRGLEVACQREAAARTPAGRSRLGILPGDRLPQVGFHRWDGSGTLAVQVQQQAGDPPVTWADVRDGRHGALRVAVQSGREEITARNGRRVTRRVPSVCRLQVRAERAKGPDGAWVSLGAVWWDVPFTCHREPPPGARVVGAQVTRERIAGHTEYHLCITVDEEAAPPRTGPAVAVDVGWRRTAAGLRVAYWVGEDGAEGEVLLPADTEGPEVPADHRRRNPHAAGTHEEPHGGVLWADATRARRDREFDVARAALDRWLSAQADLPDWLREARDGRPHQKLPDGTEVRGRRPLREWKSPAQLAALCLRWRGERFAGDDEAHAALEAWRKHDRHLWESEAHSRDQALALRRDHYRAVAADLARRYAHVIFEDMAMREPTARRPVEEAPDSEGTALRHAARLAAPGEFRAVVEQAFRRTGGTVRRADPHKTTRMHRGHEVEQDYAAYAMVYCPRCELWYDQDANAALNLLASASRRDDPPDGARGPAAPTPGGRWARAKAASAEARERWRSQSDPAGAEGETP